MLKSVVSVIVILTIECGQVTETSAGPSSIITPSLLHKTKREWVKLHSRALLDKRSAIHVPLSIIRFFVDCKLLPHLMLTPGRNGSATLETIKVQCITPSASTGYLQNRRGNGAPEVKGGNPGKVWTQEATKKVLLRQKHKLRCQIMSTWNEVTQEHRQHQTITERQER